MNQSTFLPRLAAYCIGLPVVVILYLSSQSIISREVMLPLVAVALFVAIWGQARIRRSYPQDFSQRVEWQAFGVFLVLVIIGAVSIFG
ncbi:hypothetical protein MTX78_07810 [Hymenobacter tibetensis]|uniref:Uncharacterized protein n=1 Tax=Hymenobacter tibetensis TaxID=497967 RepID=A0ABY4D3J3_9BACT|nr:hypothetical protein [Hymenobacter tibetensis]UOG76494.1 hypothetical protein MTX78_07810 [Hymenobacter tibetensis]